MPKERSSRRAYYKSSNTAPARSPSRTRPTKKLTSSGDLDGAEQTGQDQGNSKKQYPAGFKASNSDRFDEELVLDLHQQQQYHQHQQLHQQQGSRKISGNSRSSHQLDSIASTPAGSAKMDRHHLTPNSSRKISSVAPDFGASTRPDDADSNKRTSVLKRLCVAWLLVYIYLMLFVLFFSTLTYCSHIFIFLNSSVKYGDSQQQQQLEQYKIKPRFSSEGSMKGGGSVKLSVTKDH